MHLQLQDEREGEKKGKRQEYGIEHVLRMRAPKPNKSGHEYECNHTIEYTTNIIGSAEALPILCVSDFCERVERERDACDVIDITLKSRVIMHMITSTARRPNASTRSESEPVERSNFEVHVKTRSLALERSIEQQGRVIDERRWGSGSVAFAGQTAMHHPAAFRWHASSKKNRPS